VRRATVDDLVPLRRLWQQARWPVDALEKRLTEFQVVETAAGDLLGSVGLQIENAQGKIHTEVYRDPGQTAELRPRLWERLQSLSRNHGLSRLWVENGNAMFWLERGFEVAGSDLLKTMPPCFGAGDGQQWLTLKLRDETETALLLERELAVFRETQREGAEAVARQARLLRLLAGVLVCGVLLLIAWSVWAILHHLKHGR
jgi:N-acetylglutamate synthase-like GNAT family acetyltransferase